ncbi:MULTISPECIES: alpha/beta family hydrolase [Streptomyces]|uniref:Phosphoribosyltransferase n=1 Tax=Streptomyces morookaense TaxID=1970 RepID=A0A7Y7B0J9_STRMO|nr:MULTISPECIES: alpha/beta family hydrolase [Streptomyces]MCC2274325.1 phosphoribosyltransferase [Streptomyces sp. ET3-23]NVK76599.1 phosphoribosyltransferase [Streptomyces morookaense]GHF08289.1 putative phosphoribosyl transferase [Streptomyces morookaense]
MRFTDRTDAGRQLAERLRHLRSERPVVLGLPRGGVPVAFEVAAALGAPLDVILVRKLGVPFHRELGFGAIGEGGVKVVREDIVRMSRVDEDDLAEVERSEEAVLAEQARSFRGGRPRIPLDGRTAVVVDDGIATGSTASAACRVARAQGAARVVLAVPVAPPDAVAVLTAEVDELVCPFTPAVFSAVGEWYRDFSQTADEEVVELLRRNRATVRSGNGDADGNSPDHSIPVEVPVEGGAFTLTGDLALPAGAPGIVVFAHGSGSSRTSPRNRAVAQALNAAGLGTLLFDLLTPQEESDRANVFAIEPLARRLAQVSQWLRRESLPLCYFGASTGAAAALWAAADDSDIAAVVSRGGRPDLAGPQLGRVRAPTLLIVGGRDETVLDLNREAAQQLRCEHRLTVVPGATHLFEEPGALDAVAELARDWFTSHLAPSAPAARAA